jgi:hypothetical protein
VAGLVDPAHVAALALHLMSNTAVTGVTYDIGGVGRRPEVAGASLRRPV